MDRLAGATQISDQMLQAALAVLQDSGWFECQSEDAGKQIVEQMFVAAQGAKQVALENSQL